MLPCGEGLGDSVPRACQGCAAFGRRPDTIRPSAHDFAFKGLIRCGSCGRGITAEHNRRCQGNERLQVPRRARMTATRQVFQCQDVNRRWRGRDRPVRKADARDDHLVDLRYGLLGGDRRRERNQRRTCQQRRSGGLFAYAPAADIGSRPESGRSESRQRVSSRPSVPRMPTMRISETRAYARFANEAGTSGVGKASCAPAADIDKPPEKRRLFHVLQV